MEDIIDRKGVDEHTHMCGAAIFLHSRHPEMPSNFCVLAKGALEVPHIMVQRNKNAKMQMEDSFCMTVCDSPEVEGEIGAILSSDDILYFKAFIKKYKMTLLGYWNGELDASDLANRLRFDLLKED